MENRDDWAYEFLRNDFEDCSEATNLHGQDDDHVEFSSASSDLSTGDMYAQDWAKSSECTTHFNKPDVLAENHIDSLSVWDSVHNSEDEGQVVVGIMSDRDGVWHSKQFPPDSTINWCQSSNVQNLCVAPQVLDNRASHSLHTLHAQPTQRILSPGTSTPLSSESDASSPTITKARVLKRRPGISRRQERQEKKPEICEICFKGHPFKRELKRHYISNHRIHAASIGLDTSRKICNYCKKTFSRDDHLTRHLNRKHARSRPH